MLLKQTQIKNPLLKRCVHISITRDLAVAPAIPLSLIETVFTPTNGVVVLIALAHLADRIERL